MAFHDHDDHRNRIPSQRTRGSSNIGIAVFWIAVLVGLFAAFRLLPMRREPEATIPPPKVTSVPTRPTEPAPSSPADLPRSASRTPNRPSDATAPIYRCGNAYRDEPCVGGRVVDVAVASGFDSRPSERLARQVAEGRSTDDSAAAAMGGTVTTTTVNGRVVGASEAFDRDATCAALANELAAIDRAALRPQSAPSQDRLRRSRSEVRDRQLRSRC